MSLAQILKQQKTWATQMLVHRLRNGVPVNGGLDGVCLPTVEDNLFQPFHPETRRELEEADGSELGRPGQTRRPKFRSVRSSSALAVNFFDPWRERDLTPLAQALGVDGSFVSLRFEQKFAHGLPPKWPNLDVVLAETAQKQPVGIECKFAEPYNTPTFSLPLDVKYFKDAHGPRKRWEELGLPRCQSLADTLGHTVRYTRLGAGQLLKHVLGLAYTGQSLSGHPRLLYLWYDAGTQEARQHAEEIADFQTRIDDGVEFHAMTYQDVFERVRHGLTPAHSAYLQTRYFPSAVALTHPNVLR